MRPRAYDPARGNPEILAVVPNKTEYGPPYGRLGLDLSCCLAHADHPAWVATACGWGLAPKAGFVKVARDG
jgi:hypothetical protein